MEQHNDADFITSDVMWDWDDYEDDEMHCPADSVDGWYGAANWYGPCATNSMFGKYPSQGDSGLEFMCWRGFDGDYKALKTMRLMVRPVG